MNGKKYLITQSMLAKPSPSVSHIGEPGMMKRKLESLRRKGESNENENPIKIWGVDSAVMRLMVVAGLLQ